MASSEDEWERRQPGPREVTFALGAVSLNYGQLENIFAMLFEQVTGMTDIQVEVLFQRLPNDARLKIFDQLLSVNENLSDELKSMFQHFAKGFEACVDNRNAVVHSHSMGTLFSNGGGMLLAKRTRSGDTLVCSASATLIRRVADEIASYSVFAAELHTTVKFGRMRAERGLSDAPSPSIQIPDLPASLEWIPLSTFQASQRQPLPSRE